MFDTTGLTEIKMRKKNKNGWYGSYFIDPEDPDLCLAKTCSNCQEVKESEQFAAYTRGKFKLQSECRNCTYSNSIAPTSDGTSVYYKKASDGRRKKYRERTREQILQDRLTKRPTGKKRCRTCRLTLPLTDYHEYRGTGDGLHTACKVCRLAKMSLAYSRKYEEYWNSSGVSLSCYLCDGPFEEIEHLIPTSHPNGHDVPENTLPSCSKCNRGPSGKHSTPLEEYIFKVNHPTKTKAQILHEIVMRGTWPFSNTTPEEFVQSCRR